MSLALKMEEGGHKAKKEGDILQLKRQENRFISRAPRKESSLADTLILAR